MKRIEISLLIIGGFSVMLLLDMLLQGMIKNSLLVTEDSVIFTSIISILILSFSISYFFIGKQFSHLKIPLDWGFDQDKSQYHYYESFNFNQLSAQLSASKEFTKHLHWSQGIITV